VKILTLGSSTDLQSLRCELSSETDLFFHWTYAVTEGSFGASMEAAKLGADLSDYPDVLVRLLEAVSSDPARNLGVFVITRSGGQKSSFGRLDLLQVPTPPPRCPLQCLPPCQRCKMLTLIAPRLLSLLTPFIMSSFAFDFAH
jgi:hypothetical protein